MPIPIDNSKIANKYNCITVLKGAGTLISDGKIVYINQTGNINLATAGSGDILAGIIVGLLAQGFKTLKASLLAVYLHGKSADKYSKNHNNKSMLASEILLELP